MLEVNDSTLLKEYVEHGSEEAFATLVARQVHKVYSIALRHMIGVDAKDNGEPVRLDFDTGASRPFSNRQAADRLALKPRPELRSGWSRPQEERLVTLCEPAVLAEEIPGQKAADLVEVP